MSLVRGIQSAIFYYVSCGPCNERKYRKKRRRQAERDKAEKQALALEQPGTYHHPSPFEMNPNWQEEVELGPGPPPRKGRKAQRALTTANTNSSFGSNGNSSATVSPVDSANFSDDHWNRRRYQRADEELVEHDEMDSRPEGVRQYSVAGSSTGFSGWTRDSVKENYYTARIPPVNDLHPPIVCTPSPHLSERKWMTEPPPSARFMNGKDKGGNRSRSGSGTSSRRGGDMNLGRQVGQRMVDEKLRRGETPEMLPVSPVSSYRTLAGHRHDRDASLTSRPGSSQSVENHKTRHPAPVVGIDDSDNSNDTVVHISSSDIVTVPKPTYDPNSSPRERRPRTAKLSTAVSNGSPNGKKPHAPATSTLEDTDPMLSRKAVAPRLLSSNPNGEPLVLKKQRPPLIIADSSLNILQELVSPNALLNSRFASSPALEAKIQLPPTDSKEDLQLKVPEIESWFPGADYWFPDERDENRRVPRDVRMRWSMDF